MEICNSKSIFKELPVYFFLLLTIKCAICSITITGSWVNLSFLWHLLVLLKILVNRFANLSLAFIKICQLTWFTKYTITSNFWELPGHRTKTERSWDVQKMSRTSFERLMSVQFISWVQRKICDIIQSASCHLLLLLFMRTESATGVVLQKMYS